MQLPYTGRYRKLGITAQGRRKEETMKILFFGCCFVVLSLLVVAPQTAAQVKPLIENDQVKIYEVTIKVGVKTLEHSHPADEATYVLSGGKGKVTLPDGTTKINDYKTGEVTWRTTPETHVAENIGDTEIRLLTIQLKKPQGQGRTKEP